MNINNPTTFSTPDLTLSTSNSSGTAGALRADDTLLVYDSTVPEAVTSGGSSATGDTATAARRNHQHSLSTITFQTAASVAEMEAASSNTVPVTPGRFLYSPSSAKCYGSVASDGTLQANDLGIDDVTRNSAGDYTVEWDTAFVNANYALSLTGEADHTDIRSAVPATDSVRVLTFNGSGSSTDCGFFVIAYGEI